MDLQLCPDRVCLVSLAALVGLENSATQRLCQQKLAEEVYVVRELNETLPGVGRRSGPGVEDSWAVPAPANDLEVATVAEKVGS